MTDREKVMAELTGLQLWLQWQVILVPGHEDWQNALKVCTDALELLKEQEAELSFRNAKPITHTATKLDDATCPSCGNVVRVRYDFCPYCGQKLDWEGR